MVRCSECKNTFKQHTGKCWKDGMCNKCWTKNRRMEYTAPKTNSRRLSTPTDFYLDQYVQHEVQNIDN